jgi:hypothetical protein
MPEIEVAPHVRSGSFVRAHRRRLFISAKAEVGTVWVGPLASKQAAEREAAALQSKGYRRIKVVKV